MLNTECGPSSFYGSMAVFYILAINILLTFAYEAERECGETGGTDRYGEVVAVTAPTFMYGETPHWDRRYNILYFTDVDGQTISSYDPKTKALHTIPIEGGKKVSTIIPLRQDGYFLIGRGRDLVVFRWDRKSSRGPLVVITSVETNKPDNAFNDGKADASGRLWIGTRNIEHPAIPLQGSFYSFTSPSLTPTVQIAEVTTSTGLGWNGDNTQMYHIDSDTRNFTLFDFNLQKGTISNPRLAFSLDDYDLVGFPAGLCVDSGDLVWVAIFGAGLISQINPRTGELLRSVQIPVSTVTNCAFGGPKLDVMYVTTRRDLLTEQQLQEQPLGGALFAVYGLGVKGQKKPHNVKIATKKAPGSNIFSPQNIYGNYQSMG